MNSSVYIDEITIGKDGDRVILGLEDIKKTSPTFPGET